MFFRKWKIAASLLLVAGLWVVVSRSAAAEESTPAANLLPNPSFEQRRGDDVEGWKSRAWAGEAAGRWTVETPGRTGGQCVSIASEKGLDAAWTTTVAVEPEYLLPALRLDQDRERPRRGGGIAEHPKPAAGPNPARDGNHRLDPHLDHLPLREYGRGGNQLPVRRLGQFDRPGLVRRRGPGADRRSGQKHARRSSESIRALPRSPLAP